jgi:Thiopurine S-methyltransferase (TPMT)
MQVEQANEYKNTCGLDAETAEKASVIDGESTPTDCAVHCKHALQLPLHRSTHQRSRLREPPFCLCSGLLHIYTSWRQRACGIRLHVSNPDLPNSTPPHTLPVCAIVSCTSCIALMLEGAHTMARECRQHGLRLLYLCIPQLLLASVHRVYFRPCRFLCALPPEQRKDWAQGWARLIAPGGELVTMMFPVDPEKQGGPPYAVSHELYTELLTPVGT